MLLGCIVVGLCCYWVVIKICTRIILLYYWCTHKFCRFFLVFFEKYIRLLKDNYKTDFNQSSFCLQLQITFF